MKIAWFHTHLIHTNSGGTRFVLNYAEYLKKLYGHDITVFTDIASDETIKAISDTNIDLVIMDHKSTNSFFYWLTLYPRLYIKRKKYASILSGFDLIISSMFPMNLLIQNINKPKVQICYEPFAFFYDTGYLKNFKLQYQYFFKIMKFLYSKQDIKATKKINKIITINKTNIKKTEEIYNITPSVVYAGIDTNIYKPLLTEHVKLIKNKHLGNPLLFHSTDLTGIKGSFRLLQIISELRKTFPEIKLIFTIYVNDTIGTERFLKKIKELGIEKNCEYLGCLEKDQLPLYYNAVDFVCQPSINQPANWPLKESLLCGTPIIGGIESEEVIDFVNGCKINVNEMKESFVILSKLFAETDRLQVSSAKIIKDYSIRSCISLFNDILRKKLDEDNSNNSQ